MSFFKRVCNFIKDGINCYIQLILLFCSLIIPFCLNLSNYLQNNIVDVKQNTTDLDLFHIFTFFILKNGKNIIFSIFLFVILIIFFRKHNESKMLNTGNIYHTHSYIYYLICAKLLGFKKCSLILVPNYMQLKLVIEDTFSDYFYGEDSSYSNEDNANIEYDVIKTNQQPSITELLNIVISDTYPIDENMLPHLYSTNSTIYIKRRNNDENKSRLFSKELISILNNEIRNLNGEFNINLFANINPKNALYIGRDVFKSANRSNVKHLKVFKQSKGPENNWKFDEQGIKIY